MFELNDGGYRLAAHVFNGILIAQPVGTLHGVVHVPAPIILAHVAKRRADTTLGGDRMTSRWKHFADAGRPKPRFSESKRSSKARTTGADDDDIVGVFDEGIRVHQEAFPSVMLPRASSAIERLPLMTRLESHFACRR